MKILDGLGAQLKWALAMGVRGVLYRGGDFSLAPATKSDVLYVSRENVFFQF